MVCVRVWACGPRGLLGCAFLLVWLPRLWLAVLLLMVVWGCCRFLLAGALGSLVSVKVAWLWGGLISVVRSERRGWSVAVRPLSGLVLMVMAFLFLVRARPRLRGLLSLR